MDDLPDDEVRAITKLRQRDPDLIDRHFVYSHLEALLYRSRDAFTSALEEYGQACRQHDSEMDTIRQALMAKWGQLSWLETYRQMAIRQQKAKNFEQALWWAERGIAIYGTTLPARRLWRTCESRQQPIGPSSDRCLDLPLRRSRNQRTREIETILVGGNSSGPHCAAGSRCTAQSAGVERNRNKGAGGQPRTLFRPGPSARGRTELPYRPIMLWPLWVQNRTRPPRPPRQPTRGATSPSLRRTGIPPRSEPFDQRHARAARADWATSVRNPRPDRRRGRAAKPRLLVPIDRTPLLRSIGRCRCSRSSLRSSVVVAVDTRSRC
jgi:hypothetical protein